MKDPYIIKVSTQSILLLLSSPLDGPHRDGWATDKKSYSDVHRPPRPPLLGKRLYIVRCRKALNNRTEWEYWIQQNVSIRCSWTNEKHVRLYDKHSRSKCNMQKGSRCGNREWGATLRGVAWREGVHDILGWYSWYRYFQDQRASRITEQTEDVLQDLVFTKTSLTTHTRGDVRRASPALSFVLCFCYCYCVPCLPRTLQETNPDLTPLSFLYLFIMFALFISLLLPVCPPSPKSARSMYGEHGWLPSALPHPPVPLISPSLSQSLLSWIVRWRQSCPVSSILLLYSCTLPSFFFSPKVWLSGCLALAYTLFIRRKWPVRFFSLSVFVSPAFLVIYPISTSYSHTFLLCTTLQLHFRPSCPSQGGHAWDSTRPNMLNEP